MNENHPFTQSVYLPAALKLPFTVSVELRLRDTETLNLTLFGLNNHSFLHLHPPEEEDGKEEGKEKDDEGQRKAFYCCLPALPTSESARQSHCLLWFTNQTLLTATAKDQLPWKLTQKGWCQDKRAESLLPVWSVWLYFEMRGDH